MLKTHRNRNRCQLALEQLEDRWTPAGTVTGSFANGTWTLIGDDQSNTIRINATATPGSFNVTGDSTAVTGVTNPTGVKNITVKLLGGEDFLDINTTGQLVGKLAGNLTIDGGSEANYAYISNCHVDQNLTVRNGINTTKSDEFYLLSCVVKGQVAINNGNGDSSTEIGSGTVIGKDVRITNGVGTDITYIRDTNIGGSVVVQNGLPGVANMAGSVQIYNSSSRTSRSLIGDNVAISYQGSGTVGGGFLGADTIWDYEIRGSVSFNHGSGQATTLFDGQFSNQPVLIHGNLTIKDMGQSYIGIGEAALYTGLVVGQNLTVVSGGEADGFSAYHLRVNGGTFIQTGGGSDKITIDDSLFLGLHYGSSPFGFQLLTGAGNDVVNIETALGTSGTTQVRGPALVNLGSGDDTLTTGFAGDATRKVKLSSLAFLFGGADTDTFNRLNLDAVFSLPIHVLFETVNR